jgi:choline dehydrogenase-like flavoprotein
VGVEYLRHGQTVRASAEREVVLAGGVFNSPQLLMLSGIGPADHLREYGIEPVLDLPGVGANLQDHPAVALRWARKGLGAFHREMRADRMIINLIRAYLLGSGPATYLPGGTFAFIRTRPDRGVPDIQFLFPAAPADVHLWCPGLIPPYPDGFGVRPCLLHPKSRGSLRLRSADPLAPIRIFQNFFGEAEDLVTLREGCKIARDVIAQEPLHAYRGAELEPGPKVESDQELDDWIKATVTTSSHPSCSCAMGVGKDAVLDAELRVRGMQGLRVVDASAMPKVTSGNINACVLMIAEKAADLLKKQAAATGRLLGG